MKFLFSILFFLFTYCASAHTAIETVTDQFSIEATTLSVDVSDRGKKRKRAQRKKARHGKKMNKKRKRACGKWGGRSYAG